MVKTKYDALASRPEELAYCIALDAGDYPKLYKDRVETILGTISDNKLKEIVKQTLGSFQVRDEKLAESSSYKLAILQDILPKGKVLVARSRLEIAKQNNSDFLSGFYVDFGLNLVSGDEGYSVNSVQAEVLANDLKNIGINLTSPKLIPYGNLTAIVNEKSPSGLVFRLSEQGRDLAKSNILNTSDFEWHYSPSKNGLFRAYLDGYGYWYADGVGLAYSSDDGRVVVETTGEASAKNFASLRNQADTLFQRQKQEREDLIAKLRQ